MLKAGRFRRNGPIVSRITSYLMEDVYTIQSGVYNSDETFFLRCISLKDPNPRVVILREMGNGGYRFISNLYVEE